MMDITNYASRIFYCTLLVVACCGGTRADAAVVLVGNVPQTDEEVQFGRPGLTETGQDVQGITNNTHAIVTFTGAVGETLNTPSNGQARIEATDGAFDFLRIEILGGTFKSLILNLNTLPKSTGHVQFSTDEVGSAPVASSLFPLGNGSNFFTLTSLLGFQSISLSTDVDVASIELGDARQFRIGGVATPEPASLVIWSLISVSVGAVSMKAKRRFRS